MPSSPKSIASKSQNHQYTNCLASQKASTMLEIVLFFYFFYRLLPLLCLWQANKDAARYPVAAKVAELLIRGIVSLVCYHAEL